MTPSAIDANPIGKVYFLVMSDPREVATDLGLVKIGITRGDVAGRILSLQTGNPYDLRCFDWFDTQWANEVEHFMHRTHASKMHRNEWLICRRDSLEALVAEAKGAAERIEKRKNKERDCFTRVSTGNSRRATPEEKRLHLDARKLTKELLPAQLRLEIAEHRLKAATETTYGVPGIVTVKYIPAMIRFSERAAWSKFPSLASQCLSEKVSGSFRWRGMPTTRTFASQLLEAKTAKRSAILSARAALDLNAELNGLKDRTPDLEVLHDDFLNATRLVHRFRAEVADLRTELIVRLGDNDALEGVCSFKRILMPHFASAVFLRNFPEEAKQCAELIGPRLRKHVYPSRSYLSTEEEYRSDGHRVVASANGTTEVAPA